ncbi:hypothetical protein [Streptosporangium saharense]|uniref:hypothetical protein n=1 Tax=Streptosporangium saharense TaxID=1706840 RepID=UPI00369534FB
MCNGKIAGRLSAHQDHWRVDNQGGIRLIVENIEHPDEYFGIAPGRAEVPVPFVTARVVSAQETEVELTVLGPTPPRPGGVSSESATAGQLDRDTAYYAVLHTLCGPRLWHGPESRLPTSGQIAAALRASGYRLTPRAVDAHIDYLLDKLGARPVTGRITGRGWKREVLVTRAMRLGLVTFDHDLTPVPAVGHGGESRARHGRRENQ